MLRASVLPSGRQFLTPILAATAGLGLSLASPAGAAPKGGEARFETLMAKRTNGHDSTVAETGDVAVAQARSNGRGRGGATETVVDEDLPLPLEFAREDGAARASGSNGRGRVAGGIDAELPQIDLAAVTPETLETAEPETPAALMAQYRLSREALFAVAARQDAAHAAYIMLRDYDAAQVANAFPDGGYDAALDQARQAFFAARDEVAAAQEVTRDLLLRISGGKPLSDMAVRELNVLLGV